ncbi:MAG: AAA family ATPase [Pseudomonadota bacterium]|nr:AAA family ATPase [Pseudomonadota bacterium]
MNALSLQNAICTNWGKPDFIFSGLQAGDLGLISGGDGVGKSFLSDLLAATAATGLAIGNIFTPPQDRGGVLIIKGEDRKADHGRRIQGLVKQIDHDFNHIDFNNIKFDLICLEGQRMPLAVKGLKCEPVLTDQYNKFVEITAGYQLVIIDPLIMFHTLDEDNIGMDFLGRSLIRAAFKNHQAIIAVHHSSQDSILNSRSDHHSGRGGTALPAACRAVWTIRGMSKEEGKKFKLNEDERREWKLIWNGKQSHGPESAGVWVKRDENGLLYKPTRGPGMESSFNGGNNDEWE